MTQEAPEIPTAQARGTWQRRLSRLVVLAILFGVGAAAARTRRQWWPYAKVPLLRLQAELRPILKGAEKRLAEPASDPTLGQPSAADLAAPEGPARARRARAETAGRKAPLLNDRGVAMEDELRPAIGGQVLLDEVKEPEWKRQAGPLIGVCLGLGCFFMLIAYWRGSGRHKTLN